MSGGVPTGREPFSEMGGLHPGRSAAEAREQERLIAALTASVADALSKFASKLAEDRANFIERNRLIEADAAAALLGVSEQWVRRWTADGLIPRIKLGALVRYHPPTLVEWALSRQEVPDELSR